MTLTANLPTNHIDTVVAVAPFITKPVSSDLIARLMRPYAAKKCIYVTSADAGQENGTPKLRATMSIPESCYIDDTGHFNAVEFNMCYNQMMYILMAMSIDQKVVPALSDWDLSRFLDKQLSHFLVLSLTSGFRRPINPRRFFGQVEMATEPKPSRKAWLVETGVSFWDADGGAATGTVTLAVLRLNAPGSLG